MLGATAQVSHLESAIMNTSARPPVLAALLLLGLTIGPSRLHEMSENYGIPLKYDSSSSGGSSSVSSSSSASSSSSGSWTPRASNSFSRGSVVPSSRPWADDPLMLSTSSGDQQEVEDWTDDQLLNTDSSSSSAPWERDWANLQRPQRKLTKDILSRIAQQLGLLFARTNLAGYIRLVFHDCIGGCDGCINFSNSQNKGLEEEVADLEGVYQRNNYEKLISRADFWAYAAHLAVEKAFANSRAQCYSADCKASDPGMIFRYGRKDCLTSPFTTKFVNIYDTIGREDPVLFFARTFDFNDQETVAIMGAHNMALARKENSGHTGLFVANQVNKLSNSYYKALLKKNYVQVANTPDNQTNPHFQWNLVGETGFMLNTDLELLKDLKVDPTGKSSCAIKSCQLSRFSSHVLRYANNNDEFVRDFAAAFSKMISRGTAQLFDIV